MSETQRPGQWCWCANPPKDQQPHNCATDHSRRRGRQRQAWQRQACRGDGAHVHPVAAEGEAVKPPRSRCICPVSGPVRVQHWKCPQHHQPGITGWLVVIAGQPLQVAP